MNKTKAIIVTSALAAMTALIILGLYLLHCYIAAGILIGLLALAGFVFAFAETLLWLVDDELKPEKRMEPVTVNKAELEGENVIDRHDEPPLPLDFDTVHGEIEV